MSAQENAALAHTIYDAFNCHDVDRILALSAEDITVVTTGALGRTEHGHQGLRRFLHGWAALAPDGRVEIVHQWAGDQGVANECRFHGTTTGPVPALGGETLPTGRSIDVLFVEAWGIKDGKLRSLHHTLDIMTLLRQLGVDPLPAIPQRCLHYAGDASAVCAEAAGAVVLTAVGAAAQLSY